VIVTGDSGASPKSVTIKRNGRSRSNGIVGHVPPEFAVTMVRNTQMTAGAANAEWTDIGATGIYIQSVDRATIRRNGNLVKMWGLKDYKTMQTVAGDSFLSSKTQAEYNCKEDRSRTLAFLWFDGQMGNGKVVYSNGNLKDEWAPITPGSVAERLWKIACGKQ